MHATVYMCLAYQGNFPRFWSAIDRLLELALIKRDRKTASISLHRLVQTQFRFHMSSDQRQNAFANAALLLDNIFPTRPRSSHQMYDVWVICRQYLQHVLALMRIYAQEMKTQAPLRPTKHFCQLLVRCGR